jgi:glycerol uptake facilitator-like aquaporin
MEPLTKPRRIHPGDTVAIVSPAFGAVGQCRTGRNGPRRIWSRSASCLAEGVATLLFVMVISAVATDTNAPWNGVLAPVAIGGFIFVAAIGPFTSGSFNPARSLAPALLEGSFGDLWVFLVGPLVGGALGGIAYAAIRRSKEAAAQP